MGTCFPVFRAVAAALAVSSFLTACGGGGGSDSTQEVAVPDTSLGGDSDPSTNLAPTAFAGQDKFWVTGTTISVTGEGTDPDGDSLVYDWILASQPAGSNLPLTNSYTKTVSFTPTMDGQYELQLLVNDGQLSSSPDSVVITTYTPGNGNPPPEPDPTPEPDPAPAPAPDPEPAPAPEPDPTPEPDPAPEPDPTPEPDPAPAPQASAPLADSYASTVVFIGDDFGNGNIANSALQNSQWTATSGTGVSISESGGKLSINSTGTAAASGYIQSDVDNNLNFFVQPLQFRITGLAMNGNAPQEWQKKLQFALTSSKQAHTVAGDALLLSLQGNGRIRLSAKSDQPNAAVESVGLLLDEVISFAPTEIILVVDQSSYRIVARSGGNIYTAGGLHGLAKGKWGNRGDSAMAIEGLRNATQSDGTNATIQIDAFDVQSLVFFDDFENGILDDTGGRRNFWLTQSSSNSVVDVAENSGEVVIASSGGSGSHNGRLISPVTKDFNFFGEDLVFSGRVQLGSEVAKFGISSEAKLPWAADDAIVLSIGSDRRVRLGWKNNLPSAHAETQNILVNQLVNQLPEAFELHLDKRSYNLTVYWDGGQQNFAGDHALLWHKWGANGNASISIAGLRESGSGSALARWDNVSVWRDMPYYLAPTVYGPIGDGISLEVPELSSSHTLAEWGMVDVTKAPFNADASGTSDSTEALQHAIDFAREHGMVTYFPAGTYLVSDTLNCDQHLFLRSTGLLAGHREEGPCMLLGSRTGAERPRIVLAANSPGFNDPSKGKSVIYIWARSYKGNPEADQTNIIINSMVVNLDVEVRSGNPGAIGIRDQGAQGSGIEDVTVWANDGLTGILGGSGSGGSHTNVTVIGGEIGIDMEGAQPAPTLTGATLLDQRKHAIFYKGPQNLAVVGTKIRLASSATGPAIQVPTMSGGWSAVKGQLSLRDTVIEFPVGRAGNKAVAAGRSVFMQDVYIRNAGKISTSPDGASLDGNAGGWQHVREYAHGVRPPVYTDFGIAVQYETPIYENGVRRTTDLVDLGGSSAPPADIQSRHVWSASFPSWQSAGAANVKQAPYNAKGDGVTDDTDALQAAIDNNAIVFIPKGYFRTTRPLNLKSNTKLVGLARHLSNIVGMSGGSFDNAASPQPLVRTVDSPSSDTVLAFIGLHAPIDQRGVYAVQWRSGQNSISRDVNIVNRSAYGFAGAPGKPNPPDTNVPLAVITGNGGGKWYNFYQESHWKQGPGYRHLLIEGTSQPLSLYQLNPEHAQSDANVEIRNSVNIDIYSVKGEGNYAALWIRDSDNINVYGFGGNAAAFSAQQGYPAGYAQYTPTLIRVERTPNFRLVNIVDYGRARGNDPVFGVGVDPNLWHAILDNPGTGTVLSNKLDRPVLFKRSNQ